MVDTWRDSWFEEGSRLFYIFSRRAVDAALPLEIRPAPSTLVRVFVGRIELITDATRREVSDALGSNDRHTLSKYARFLPAIVASLPDPAAPGERVRWSSAVNAAQPPDQQRSCR